MRRFDKKLNIIESNLLLELSHASKESDFISDYEYMKTLFECCDELGIDYRPSLISLNENKQPLNEAFGTMAVIGTALASGKLLDLIGTFFRRIWNGVLLRAAKKNPTCKDLGKEQRLKCAEQLIKDHPKLLGKTWFEKAGEWLHEKLIMGIFRGVATALVAIFAPAFLIKGDSINDDLINKIAVTLFYATITIIGVHGAMTVLSHAGHGAVGITEITETITSTTKFYEIILLIVAFFVLRKHGDKLKTSLSHLAHAIGDCVEGGGKVGVLVGNLKQMAKDMGYRDKIMDCVFEHSGGDHGHSEPSETDGEIEKEENTDK